VGLEKNWQACHTELDSVSINIKEWLSYCNAQLFWWPITDDGW